MSDQHVFSIAPLEMARDRRLAAAHYRLLLALLSFRSNTGNLVWPSRRRLGEITGYTVQNVSRYTRELARLGWLHKEGNGGRNQPTRYRIDVPDLTRIEAETVSDPNTVLGPETVSDPDTKTVSDPDTRIEQTIEQTKNNKGKTRKIPTAKQQAKSGKKTAPVTPPSWINPQDWQDYLDMRKTIKRPMTDKAKRMAFSKLDKMRGQGQNISDVLQQSVFNAWQGLFEVKTHATHQPAHRESAREHHARISEIMDRNAREAVAELMGETPVCQATGDLRH